MQTLANFRLSAQQRSNQESKTLVSTAEWNRYVNLAISELYDIIVATNPHYYVKSASFTLSSVNTFDLTTVTPTFYKLRGLDFVLDPTRPLKVNPLNFQERNKYQPLNFSGNYTLWYTPLPPVLVNDGDTTDFILDNWSEFIEVTAAIAGAVKEDAPELAGLAATKAAIVARINAAATNRDGEAGQAADLSLPGMSAGDSGRRYMMEGSGLTILGSDSWFWA